MKKIFKTLLNSNSNRRFKKIVIVILDWVVASFACYLSFALRYINGLIESMSDVLVSSFIIAPTIMLISLWIMGVYNFVLRSIGLREIWKIVIGVGFAVFAWGTAVLLLRLSVPRSVILIYGFTATTVILGIRFLISSMLAKYDPVSGSLAKSLNASNVLIYGAGTAGRQLLNSLNRGNEYQVKGFIDDNKSLQGSSISGVKVYSFSRINTLIDFSDIRYILMAMPSISNSDRKKIVKQLEKFPVLVKTLPSTADIISGKATVSQIREIDVIDLLGRDEIAPKKDLMEKNIKNCSVMVTGAGGSIGSEICKSVSNYKPKKIIVFELNEYALYNIENTLKKIIDDKEIEIVSVLGNVLNEKLLEKTMRLHSVDTLYHAAAYKHVSIVESNKQSGVLNNIFGTHSTVSCAVKTGVKNFVLISTDKAVRPTNVMGASKRMAEMVVQSIANNLNDDIKFSIVRFGNVLDSSGSVIPKFRQQIKNGGPVTVTDKKVTRFFMTIPEAVNLVIQAGAMTTKADVFVLDMGSSVKILNLAEKMIELAGFEPYKDIEIKFTGLRSGEKLYEELVLGDDIAKTEHKRIMRASEKTIKQSQLNIVLKDLKKACDNNNDKEIIKILKQFVDGFKENIK
jgi:FlaA1/EpsC-like NDP-sugar epimerase